MIKTSFHFFCHWFLFLVMGIYPEISLARPCQPPFTAGITQLLAHGATLTSTIQMDYSQLQGTAHCYLETYPNTTKEVATLVHIAYQHHIPIRTQGAAHSQNGTSLPQPFELLIHTTHLKRIVFRHMDRITVDAGLPIALVNQILEEHSSFFLPVTNGGGIGPTVGGYIAAGGISAQSSIYGGFWEQVQAVTLVTGFGNIVHLKKSDPAFIWLFGSMGQLGIITQAELAIMPSLTQPFQYPFNQTLSIPYPSTDGHYWATTSSLKPLHWFNVFVTPDKQQKAVQHLHLLQKKYPLALHYFPLYQWTIAKFGRIPPLIFSPNQRFIAMGIWGQHRAGAHSLTQLKQLEKEFSQLVISEHYQRYIQAELSHSPETYKHYFPAPVYTEFKKIKAKLDPWSLFNPNSFFAVSHQH
jgi:FAD/FMN-containing dehydrogenase